jgi:protein O-mannosyl-transferase
MWVGGAVVGGLTLALFLPALQNGFVNWDDAENLLRNAQYRGLGWENLRWMFTTAHTGHYIPVTWLTFALDYLLWGADPWGYHLTAIVLHSLNALFVYLVAYRLIGLALGPNLALDSRSGELVLAAGISALLFAVHPLRVESVAWVTERRDLTAGLFTLLTILAYLTAWRRGGSGRLHARWYWAAVGLFALALLSKSIVVGLPLVLLALDVFPLRRAGTLGDAACAWRRLLIEKAPFLVLSAAVSALMLNIGIRQELLTTLDSLSVTQRIAISSYGLAFYLWKTMVPWPLSPLYPLRYPILLFAPSYLIAALVGFAITAAAILARRRWPAGLALWAAYVALLLPVLGAAHNGTQIAADRYTYLACLGWTLLGGAGVAWCLQAARGGKVSSGQRRLVLLLVATCLVSLAALTSLQIRVWRDAETLWRHALAVDPDNAFAHYHLGGALDQAGKTEEAGAEFLRAISLVPRELPNARSVFHSSFGLHLQQSGDAAGAEENYLSALRYSEHNVIALNNLGVITARRGRESAALDYFRRALREAPGLPSACENAWLLAARLPTAPNELERCPRPPTATPDRIESLQR